MTAFLILSIDANDRDSLRRDTYTGFFTIMFLQNYSLDGACNGQRQGMRKPTKGMNQTFLTALRVEQQDRQDYILLVGV